MRDELFVRLGVFTCVLASMAIWESIAPRRMNVVSRGRRYFNNLLLGALGSLLVRLIPALSAVAAAKWAADNHIGLLNQLEASNWLKDFIGLLALDLVIYGQHVASHRFPALWKFHRVHHADLDLDASSGVRFHPVEILFSMCVKVIVVGLLGASPFAVMLFEIVLNASAVFNHGNVKMPASCDRYLRWIIVTPDMHRVHHSIRPKESNSNFGFNLPWWDWLFRTYQAQPQDPHEHLTLGLTELRTELESTPVVTMLWMPFVVIKQCLRKDGQ